jgi:hypothetical protein
MSKTTSLHANSFHVLGVTIRDDRYKIVDAAEERALSLDHETCQKARSDLTNPRTRLAVETSWMPGLAPHAAEKLVAALLADPKSIRAETRVPELARANLMAAGLELVGDEETAESVAEFICSFAWVVEEIDAAQVLRDINDDRLISGFPEVKTVAMIEEALGERRKAYRAVLRNLLNSMDPDKLVDAMTDAVSVATDNGEGQGPALIDDLADAYELETQGFLQQEADNIAVLIESVRNAAPHGQSAVAPIMDKLERVARNWDCVAQPIQLSAKSRGLQHRQSKEVAYSLRSLGIDLNNDHGMLDQAHRMTALLQELFAELPEFVERLEGDAEVIAELRSQALAEEKSQAQWVRSISFRAEVGVMFKDELALGPDGIRWKGKAYELDSITKVRWGGVRNSINGIPTGTNYTVAFGNADEQHVVELRKEATYAGFVDALWKAVCVPLMLRIIEHLASGRSMSFGDITVDDDAVTLTKRRLLSPNERVRLSWSDVHVWSADGSFVIGQKADKKTYGSASYIKNWNTHLLEQIIRSGFKRGVSKLSDTLKN